MESGKERLKILGFDLVVDLVSSVIIFLSYYLTKDILTSEKYEDFIRGAFIFIAPCALEGLNILTSRAREDAYRDTIEVILSLVGIVITVWLIVIVILNEIAHIEVFRVLIAVYPIKIVSNGVCDCIYLLKERRRY